MPKILPDLKEKLLGEVERLLAQGGYSAVTIRSVANGCGVGVGTVYNYFPSKEAMIAELLLTDWRVCVAHIEAVAAEAESPEPVARCICDRLVTFAQAHTAIFRDEGASATFAGSFSQYHSLLRKQLAAPLEAHCATSFAAEFAAEALLTWSMAGKSFHEIWGVLSPLLNP